MIKETIKIPRLTWDEAKSIIIPRVTKELSKHSQMQFRVKDIVGEGFPEPSEVVVQDRTNGWSAYFNVTMKLFPILDVISGGKHIEKKLPYPLIATIRFDENNRTWDCISFMMITNEKAAAVAQQLNF